MNRNESPNISQGLATKDETRGTKREFEEEEDADSDDSLPKNEKRSGRRKIKIEYIDDKNRRHITFSKRKAGIMKKAYELSTLTGTQVLLLVVSETGLVYTFTTPKLQPLVTQPEGKNLIQSCLNAPDTTSKDTTESAPTQQTTVTPQSAQPQGPIPSQIPSPKLQRQRVQQPQALPSHGQSQQTTPGYGSDPSSGVDVNSGNMYGSDRSNVRGLQQQTSTQGYNPSLANMNYGHQYGGLPTQMPAQVSMGSVANYINNQQYSQYSQPPMGSYAPPNNQYMAQPNYWSNGGDNANGAPKPSQYSSPQPGTQK